MISKSRPHFTDSKPADLTLNSLPSDRNTMKPEFPDTESNLTGSQSVKKTITTENEQIKALQGTTNSDRKVGLPIKKTSLQRELKRTTSFIPRASPPKMKQPLGAQVKKQGRKSDTSLKNKDLEEILGKVEKLEQSKMSKTTISHFSSKISLDKNETQKDSTKGTSRNRKQFDGSRYQSVSSTVPGTPLREAARTGKNAASTMFSAEGGLRRHDDHATDKSLEGQYAAKKAAYSALIKDFEERRKIIKEKHRVLQDLRKKIAATSGIELPPEEVITLNDESPPKINTFKRKEFEERSIVTFETKILDDLNVDFSELQSVIENIIHQENEIWSHLISVFMNSRTEINKKVIEKASNVDITFFDESEKTLQFAIETARYHSKIKAEELIAEVKKLFTNRETIKHELKLAMDSERVASLITKEHKELVQKMKELEEELAKEKVRSEDLTERKNVLEEATLAKTLKINSLEQLVAAQQKKLLEMEYRCKVLKQKELLANQGVAGLKGKELKDLKAKSDLLKALQNHITELTNDYNVQKKQFECRISELEDNLNSRELALKKEIQMRQKLESSVAELEEKMRNLREKRKTFVDMVEKTKQILPTNISAPSKREENLWTELEATKIIVKGYQDQVTKLQEEKRKIFLKFQTIAEDKTNDDTKRMAAALLRKEEIIKNLKSEVTDLQKACEEHSEKYNKLLNQVKEVHERIEGKTDVVSLSKQLGDLKAQKLELQKVVNELISHNEELEVSLIQRSLELDQRDKLVKQQCSLLKMRDELNELMKVKDETGKTGVAQVMEQNTEWEKKAIKIYKDLEKKASEVDEMYKVLIEKQNQIEKLTKLVKIMEDHQDKAQEQRVRFESKIAELQKQLSEGKQKNSNIIYSRQIYRELKT